ncbi:Rid family hydrolase [Brevibacterium sp. FAM 27836]|uniref:Rid family hydrolase n=1 Tax=Brevibacterium sp. FAM 27836 TaxID=3446693 RepID=UPI003F5164B4
MDNFWLQGSGRFEQAGSYSRVRRFGDQVFVAGTTAVEPSGRLYAPGDTYAQTAFILNIIDDLLVKAGSSISDTVLTRAYLADISQASGYIKAHGEAFAEVRPVTTAVEAGLTVPGMMVEIELQAVVGAADQNNSIEQVLRRG